MRGVRSTLGRDMNPENIGIQGVCFHSRPGCLIVEAVSLRVTKAVQCCFLGLWVDRA